MFKNLLYPEEILHSVAEVVVEGVKWGGVKFYHLSLGNNIVYSFRTLTVHIDIINVLKVP